MYEKQYRVIHWQRCFLLSLVNAATTQESRGLIRGRCGARGTRDHAGSEGPTQGGTAQADQGMDKGPDLGMGTKRTMDYL